MRNFISIILLIFLLFFSCYAEAKRQKNPDQHILPAIGNFALPMGLPAPLISFGQNVLNKNNTVINAFFDDLNGSNKYRTDIIPGINHGFTQNFTLGLSVPYALAKSNRNYSSGFGNIYLQGEYAFYEKYDPNYFQEATLIGALGLPSDNRTKQPLIGNGGALQFFLGSTFSQTYVDWYIFTSPGVVVNTTHNNFKLGDDYFYQAGIGRNICYKVSEYIFSWLLEADGTYHSKDTINGILNPNTGGNIVYLTPSLSFSTQHLLLQLGAGYAVLQNLNGNQNNNHYLIASNVSWSF